MLKYLAVYDREDGWLILRPLRVKYVQESSLRTGRKLNKYHEEIEYIYPGNSPEIRSSFIQAHRIVDAESEEEACRLTLTFPKPSSETLLPSR